MSDYDRVIVLEQWPQAGGWSKSRERTAKRRAISADGRRWEVRTRFGRWRWLPVKGMYCFLLEARSEHAS